MIPRVAIRSFYLIAIGLACVAQGQAEPKPIRIGIFADKGSAGKGVPNVTAQLSKRADLQVSKLKGAEIANGALKDFDVVIFTGGSAHSQADTLGDKGRQEVRRFVKEGGGYVGICAGAYLACSGFDWGLGVLNAKTVSSKWQRGKGHVQIELTPLAQEVVQLPAEKHEILYANGPIIMPDQRQDLPA